LTRKVNPSADAAARASAELPGHAFVVPAFGEPQWLDRCLDSIQHQTIPSRVLITTSTPNAHLSAIAARRRIPLVVNAIAGGIAADWNFALANGDADWITLAHQDDWYETDYLESCTTAAARTDHAILVFTDAIETRDDSASQVLNARVKRILAGAAFLTSQSIESTLRKRLLLSFGNPIPCPSVMLNRRALPGFIFPDGWKSNLDWQAWFTLAGQPGAFVHVARCLVHRTLHADAETSRALSDRAREDEKMFHAMWPAPIAATLNRLYAPSRAPYRQLRSRR
jgi:hypothetical protein